MYKYNVQGDLRIYMYIYRLALELSVLKGPVRTVAHHKQIELAFQQETESRAEGRANKPNVPAIGVKTGAGRATGGVKPFTLSNCSFFVLILILTSSCSLNSSVLSLPK